MAGIVPEPSENVAPEQASASRSPVFLLHDLPAVVVQRSPDVEASRRWIIGMVCLVGSQLTTVLVILGGIVGRFDGELVTGMVTALAGAPAAVVYSYFRRRSTPSAQEEKRSHA
ncbi:hypothetical protein GCM10009727_19740 [Actinomadura napierensis]|uniref:Uncharacterized protein n=1 Tax=Actinomadura napierensis TaxID=267854 RepID=A0ABN2YKP8_9ACTN